MRRVIHPVYGTGFTTGQANGIFVQVAFNRYIAGTKGNKLFVSANVLK